MKSFQIVVTRGPRVDTSRFSFLQIDVRDGIAFVTFNNPDDGNRFSFEQEHELGWLVEELSADEGIRVAVLTGAGDTFCLGAHHGDHVFMPSQWCAHYVDLFSSYVTLDTPVVAAMNGPASGQGLTMALMLTDILIIEEHVQIVDPHVTNGAVTATGSFLWPGLVGESLAKRYLLTGDPIPAAEAARLGLAAEVVPTGTSLMRATELAQRMAAMPPGALRGTKKAINLRRRDSLHRLREALGIQFLDAAERRKGGEVAGRWAASGFAEHDRVPG